MECEDVLKQIVDDYNLHKDSKGDLEVEWYTSGLIEKFKPLFEKIDKKTVTEVIT